MHAAITEKVDTRGTVLDGSNYFDAVGVDLRDRCADRSTRYGKLVTRSSIRQPY